MGDGPNRIRLVKTPNPYAYADGNPANLVDPAGSNAVSDFFHQSQPWQNNFSEELPASLLLA
jgi:hypothetical protein